MDWQEDQLLAGKAIILGNTPIGAILVGLSTEPLQRKISAITQQGGALALLALAIGAGVTVLLARQITNPIRELTSVAAQMAGGNLFIRVSPYSKDEIGQLGEAFNQMAQAIQDRETELRKLAAGLERSVAERTAELRRQNEILEKMATSDPLTKAHNRRHFFNLAEHEAERARRYHRPLVILMIDADNFKKINDTYGHVCGDQMLIHLVQLCQESIRKVDILARYGGEEFVILMPESTLPAGMSIAERLRHTLANSPLDYKGQLVTLTISVGISAWAGEGTLDFENLLSQADQALYQSKQAGRDQVTTWQP
jgi:diguanylate cyclase (GGDEF)-like protein